MGWYRVLLRILAPSLWRRHGDELEALARERVDDAREAGSMAAWRAELALGWDAVASTPAPLAGLAYDVRDALRSLRASPGFAAAAVLTIGLAIGANTTIFSLVNAVLLEPLPISEPARVMAVLRTFSPDGTDAGAPPSLLPVSYPNYVDLTEDAGAFTAVAAATFGQFNIAASGEAIQVIGQYVTGEYFTVLGVTPQAGRAFTDIEGRPREPHPVIVISDGLWRRQWAADPAVIGSGVQLNGRAFTVVGIAPPGFNGLQPLVAVDVWMPVSMYIELNSGRTARALDERVLRFFQVFGRQAPGRTVAEAQAELDAHAARLADAYPDANRGRGVAVMPVTHAALNPSQRDLFERAGFILMGAVGLVLIVAAANLSNLQLVRARRRRRDRALRVALGASRLQLARRQLVESLLLAAVGGAAGALLAWWSRDAIWAARPPFLAQAALDLSFDMRLAVFTLAVTVVTGVLFGLTPALQATRADLVDDLRDRSPSSGRAARLDLRQMLVVAQVALCLVVLTGATAFVGSLQAARRIDPGFAYDRLLVAGFDAGSQGRGEAATRQFFVDALEALRAGPGVAQVALATGGPLAGGPAYRMFADDDALGPDGTYIAFNAVTPGYFEVMGLRIASGRAFDDRDRADAPSVMIINQTLADQLWPNESPIGRRLRVRPPIDIAPEIVGVVEDAKYGSLGEPPSPYVYYPLDQQFDGAVVAHLRARTDGDPGALANVVRQRLRALDPGLPIDEPRGVDALVRQSLWAPELAAWLLGLFGVAAAVLAVTGIYAVIAQTLHQRRHEIGVRLALGARPGEMASFIARRGLAPVVVGIGLGAVGAAIVVPTLRALLYGTGSTLAAIGPALTVITLAALAACALPARRAMRVDPLGALRQE